MGDDNDEDENDNEQFVWSCWRSVDGSIVAPKSQGRTREDDAEDEGGRRGRARVGHNNQKGEDKDEDDRLDIFRQCVVEEVDVTLGSKLEWRDDSDSGGTTTTQ